MSFVANFLKNTTVKEFWKLANSCQTYERMLYSGTVFFDSLCISTVTWSKSIANLS